VRVASRAQVDTLATRAAAVMRAVDYVETHLREPVTVADMAGAAAYSVFHFCRIFNSTTGQTPFDYLMMRRLTEAALALLDRDSSVTDVAFDYQFGSPEAFSRAFRRAHGVSPAEWRRDGGVAEDTLLAPLTAATLLVAARDKPAGS
jgi:AraC family transcriptional regulator